MRRANFMVLAITSESGLDSWLSWKDGVRVGYNEGKNHSSLYQA